jgi:hypothetical protein
MKIKNFFGVKEEKLSLGKKKKSINKNDVMICLLKMM